MEPTVWLQSSRSWEGLLAPMVGLYCRATSWRYRRRLPDVDQFLGRAEAKLLASGLRDDHAQLFGCCLPGGSCRGRSKAFRNTKIQGSCQGPYDFWKLLGSEIRLVRTGLGYYSVWLCKPAGVREQSYILLFGSMKVPLASFCFCSRGHLKAVL